MSEVLAGYPSTSKFFVPTGATGLSSTVERDGVVIGNPAPTVDGDVASVALPFAATAEDGEVRVSIDFTVDSQSYTQSKLITVATPYLDLFEVKEIIDSDSDEDAREIEAAVRHVINAHTGQHFGFSTKTLTVPGAGETALRLPERLLELTGLSTLTATLDINSAIVVSDGWYLKKRWADETGTLETDVEYFGEDTRPGGVIYIPQLRGDGSKWADDYPFEITGKWGYAAVPAPVREAAKLLANDYACMDSIYRDRYLKNIRAADWRMEFSSRSWEYTGNVRADLLLSDYVLFDWGII